MSEHQSVTINRTLVGVLAIVCLIGACAAFLYEEDDVNMWRGIFTRVGLVLGALWMALPKDGTLGKWANVSLTTLVGVMLAIFMVARNPRQYVPLVLAVAAIGRFLRPREKARPPREFRGRSNDQAS